MKKRKVLQATALRRKANKKERQSCETQSDSSFFPPTPEKNILKCSKSQSSLRNTTYFVQLVTTSPLHLSLPRKSVLFLSVTMQVSRFAPHHSPEIGNAYIYYIYITLLLQLHIKKYDVTLIVCSLKRRDQYEERRIQFSHCLSAAFSHLVRCGNLHAYP